MKKLLLIAILIATTISCTTDFEGWNVDKKNPSAVPPSFLLTSAQKNIFLRMTSASVNYNIFKQFAQHWTATTYPDECNYDLRQRDVSGLFSTYFYRDILMDLNEAKLLIAADEVMSSNDKAIQTGVIELMMVYAYHVLVDTYGDTPYSEALNGNGNILPKFDDDATIYADLFNRIDAALAGLAGGGNAFGDADMVYGGDTAKWIKFGNSLKLRMAVRIADADNATATAMAAAAVAGGVFDSAADNANYTFGEAPNANPMWAALVQSGRSDLVIANTFADIMNPLNDPRSPVYMDDNFIPYVGGPYGETNTFANFSHIGDAWHEPDLEGIILSYEEVLFLQAEAVEKGLIAGDAEMYYNDAITASIAYWTGSDAGAAAYIAQPTVAYDAGNWKMSIGVQKWIALYGKGFEAWSSWRVLDYPNTMNRPPVSQLPVPRRYLYGNDEAQINPANYEAASAAMGGDALDSRVFWDVTGQGN